MKLKIFAVILLALLAESSNLYAKGTDRDEFAAGVVTPLAVRSSPFEPQEASDTVFVVDDGSGLDTGCTYRSGGPLMIELPIDRVIGDRDRLIASGLLGSQVTLRLPAYDIDVNGSPSDPSVPPEVDNIYLNGNALSPASLAGDNGVWKLNTWTVPVEWLEFPEDPGQGNEVTPAVNTIRIDIDVASAPDENWCMAVDWVEAEIQMEASPVVFLHGLNSSGATWNGSAWIPYVDGLGLPHSGDEVDLGEGCCFDTRLPTLSTALEGYQKRWGVDKLTAVGHSRGGLDIRHYMDSGDYHDDVAQVVQIASPNLGSQAANRGGWAAGSIAELRTEEMEIFNQAHQLPPGVSMVSIAGQHQETEGNPTPSDCPGMLYLFTEGPLNDLNLPNDGVVSVPSALAAPGATSLPPIVSIGANADACHTFIHRAQASVDLGGGYVSAPAGTNVSLQAASTPSEVAAVSGTSLPLGFVSDGKKELIPAAGAGSVTLLVSGDWPIFMIIGPFNAELSSVKVFDPTGNPVESGSDVEIVQDPYGEGKGAVGLVIDAARAVEGEWTLQYEAANLGANPHVGAAVWNSGDLTDGYFTYWPNPITEGSSLEFEVSLTGQSGAPLSGASVEVTVGAVLVTATETSQGSGNYSGSVLSPEAGPNEVMIRVLADGVQHLANFDLDVVPAGMSVGAPLSEATVTDPTTGLITAFQLNVPVTVSVSGRYAVRGNLTTASGQTISDRSAGIDLPAGDSSIPLEFDGASIYATDENGPYVISGLELVQYENASPSVVAVSSASYETASYAYQSFEHDPVRLDPSRELMYEPLDTDGSGGYNQIVVGIPVLLDVAGTYEWAGLR